MHELAEKVILTDLKAVGVVQGDVDEMVKARLGAIFMPHGLGHFMGMDVHDCGGYLGMPFHAPHCLVLRVCERPEHWLREWLLQLNRDATLSILYWTMRSLIQGIGGVRIEDDVVIWAKGNENMNADLPRTVDQIEAFMKAHSTSSSLGSNSCLASSSTSTFNQHQSHPN
uniref:Peptidase M24 domain-containing protein n=2 Tax=Ditylenchus dipsaci TaxID=166011 RepID=A0A915DXR2_9BILA